MEATAISLIPPLIVILLVIATRRVVISISAGIIAGAFILCNFQPGETVEAVVGRHHAFSIRLETGIQIIYCWCSLFWDLVCLRHILTKMAGPSVSRGGLKSE